MLHVEHALYVGSMRTSNPGDIQPGFTATKAIHPQHYTNMFMFDGHYTDTEFAKRHKILNLVYTVWNKPHYSPIPEGIQHTDVTKTFCLWPIHIVCHLNYPLSKLHSESVSFSFHEMLFVDT